MRPLINIFVISLFLICAFGNICLANKLIYDLSIKSVKFATFTINSQENGQDYSILSRLNSKGIFGLFTQVSVNSGVVGKVFADEIYRPKEAVSKWKTLLKSGRSKIIYKNNRIEKFEYFPQNAQSKEFFVVAREQINTVDPLTLTYMLLKTRKKKKLCLGNHLISDGRNLMKLSFNKLSFDADGDAVCVGQINWMKGFNPKKYRNNKFKIQINYKKEQNNYSVRTVSMETRIGIVKALRVKHLN